MTRMLSELLGAKEPMFRMGLRELEKNAGHPSADIRLSVDILHKSFDKIRELGLDPQNTTSEELYLCLQQRFLADDQRLRDFLGIDVSTDSGEVFLRLENFIKSLSIPKNCYSLKHSVAKRLLKKTPPLKAMKRLGYRSLDSMLKHEPVPQIYAAAMIYESRKWHKEIMDAYAKLGPSDFEPRQISVYLPRNKRWQPIVEDFVYSKRHNMMAFKELGAIVLLPINDNLPALLLATVLLALSNINDIRYASSFYKLQQVKPDFGKLVAQSCHQEPITNARLSGFSLPWRFLHGFFLEVEESLHPTIFEPHVQPEDLQLAQSEKALASKLPALEFWMGTNNLAFLERGHSVSFNMIDVALSTVNSLPTEEGSLKYVRESVWHQLLARYLKSGNLEKVTQQLNAELTGAVMPEMELVEV